MGGFFGFLFVLAGGSVMSAIIGLTARSTGLRIVGFVIGLPGGLLGLAMLGTNWWTPIVWGLIGLSGVIAAFYRLIRPLPPLADIALTPAELTRALYSIPSPPREAH